MTAKQAPRGDHLTYEDYLELPDDGQRYEIIDGVLYVTPAPIPDHQRASGELYLLIASWVKAHPPAEAFYAPVDLILANDTIVQPDLLVVLSPAVITRRGVEAPPALVVEILSPSTAKRDRGLKRTRYARSHVPEYWVVDLDQRCIEQYVASPGGDLEIRMMLPEHEPRRLESVA